MGSGDGTANSPWDIRTALVLQRDDTTLMLMDGVYTLPASGIPIALRGTVKAVAGARPILVGNDGDAPRIEVQNGAVIDGVWFGSGTKQPADQPFVIKNDTTIRNCTLFGYYGGIVEGGGARNTISGCRFVECGTDALWHAIYISNGAADHWTIMQDNIFIGGAGYGTQLWHGPSNCTIRRNFYGDNEWMLVMNGDGHLAEQNIFWSNRGGATGMLGVYLAPGTYTIQRNLFGVGTLRTDTAEATGATMDNNTFYSGAPGPFGANQHVVASVAGIDAAAVDGAIASLRTSFAGVATIHGDTTIESNFAICAAAVATWVNTP